MSRVVNKDKKNAKEAKLDYEVLKYNEVKDLSLLKLNLHTGRLITNSCAIISFWT